MCVVVIIFIKNFSRFVDITETRIPSGSIWDNETGLKFATHSANCELPEIKIPNELLLTVVELCPPM